MLKGVEAFTYYVFLKTGLKLENKNVDGIVLLSLLIHYSNTI